MPHKQPSDLTTGPIAPQMWSLAWPMMLSIFFYTLYNLVDAYWVSKLSADAIAAVVGYFWIWSVMKKFDFKEVEATVHMHG